jgi:hypothetical protein
MSNIDMSPETYKNQIALPSTTTTSCSLKGEVEAGECERRMLARKARSQRPNGATATTITGITKPDISIHSPSVSTRVRAWKDRPCEMRMRMRK